MTAEPDILDMEDGVLATTEMAAAVYGLLEAGARHGLDAKQVAALLRCVSHLQDHAGEVLRRWEGLVQTGRGRAVA